MVLYGPSQIGRSALKATARSNVNIWGIKNTNAAMIASAAVTVSILDPQNAHSIDITFQGTMAYRRRFRIYA